MQMRGTEEGAASDASEWRCRECTILIGDAYQEKYPCRSPLDGRSVVCYRCYESLKRRKGKSTQESAGKSTLS